MTKQIYKFDPDHVRFNMFVFYKKHFCSIFVFYKKQTYLQCKTKHRTLWTNYLNKKIEEEKGLLEIDPADVESLVGLKA